MSTATAERIRKAEEKAGRPAGSVRFATTIYNYQVTSSPAETRAFAPLMVSDTSRNLRRVFKLSEMLKAQAPKDIAFKPMRVHVIGAGVMGADIAGWCVALVVAPVAGLTRRSPA